ncbi:Lrp/AsnC ligand binding domain-containing protein [bacterium]|nr:Lrp/AsnC ligand binding domain-containing protein [bacterium]
MTRAVILAKFERENAKEAYLELKKTFQVLPLFGNYDLMIAVEEEDYEAISRTILKINRMRGIANTDTMMVVPHEVLVDILDKH